MTVQKIEKWKRWIDRIEPDVIWLHHHRRVWREMVDTLAGLEDAEFFRMHYTRLYIDGAAMAVRRLAYRGGDDKSRSLAQLVAELIATPEVLTGDRHAEMYESTVLGAEMGRERFDEEWGDGSGALDPARLQADIDALTDASSKVSALADRTIAHIDKRGFADEVTFGDLDRAIDEIGRVFQRYRELVVGSPLMTLEPTIQGDWKAPFRSALFGADE